MKKYVTPMLCTEKLCLNDILNNSDTIVDIGGLYGEAVQIIDEYTGETAEPN